MSPFIVPLAGMATAVILALGLPIVRAYTKRLEAAPRPHDRLDPALDQRLARMESAIEAIAVEVERISEGQRFTTRLLAERAADERALPVAGATAEPANAQVAGMSHVG